jgi:predicted Rdx family selenoprotein
MKLPRCSLAFLTDYKILQKIDDDDVFYQNSAIVTDGNNFGLNHQGLGFWNFQSCLQCLILSNSVWMAQNLQLHFAKLLTNILNTLQLLQSKNFNKGQTQSSSALQQTSQGQFHTALAI